VNILRVRCQSAEEFRSLYKADLPHGGMFCPTTQEFHEGDSVVVEIVCRLLPNRVMIRGTVLSWAAAVPRLRVRAGAVVAFHAEEASKRDFVLETLGGQRNPAPRRRHTRIPIGTPVKIRIQPANEPMLAELREISVSGAHIACAIQPPLGTEVVLELIPPGAVTPMDISGRVLYHSGSDGTGIKFLFREGGGSRRLRELVRRFKTS
jgi:Tfp pilus assembly protein PilZ